MSYVLNYVESCFVESTKWKNTIIFNFLCFILDTEHRYEKRKVVGHY